MAPSLVQSVAATATATPVSLTLGSATTAGNCLIVCVVGSSSSGNNPDVTGITLGGAAGNFASVIDVGVPATDFATVSIWADPNCAGSQTAVSVAFSSSGPPVACDVVVMEWSGLATSSVTDKTASQINDSAGTTWSSTATGTTSQAIEVAIGVCGGVNASGIGTITGPSSPWTNLAQETSSSTHTGELIGYQVLSSTTTVTYSGTFASAPSGYTAVVATFKAAGGGSHTDTAAVTVTPATSAPRVHAATDTAADTITPATSAPRVHAATDTAADTVTPATSATASHGTGNLSISIASQAGTDPELGIPYNPGMWVYDSTGAKIGLLDLGGQPQLMMIPAGLIHSTDNALMFAFSLNAGTATERKAVTLTTGKESSNADAVVGLASASADNSIPAQAVIEFGGTVVLFVNSSGVQVTGQLSASNFSGSYAGGQSAPGWPIATGSGTIGPANLAPSFSNALNALYNAMVNAGLI